MGAQSFHIEKAERNERFFQSCNLGASLYNEWAVVVLFYAAVHYVDAVLARESVLPRTQRHPHDHPRRNTGVANSPTLGPIALLYLNLYDRSRDARYTHISFPNYVLNNLETISFQPVRTCARSALGLP